MAERDGEGRKGLFNIVKKDIKQTAADVLNEVAEVYAEKKYQDSFLPIFTLRDCIAYFKNESQKVAVAEGFFLSLKENPDPKNENDCFIVTQALLNSDNKPIVVNGETISRILHTKTIDDALIRAMDGKETKIFKK